MDSKLLVENDDETRTNPDLSEYKNIQEDIIDNDGENRNTPEDKKINELSATITVIKTMVGSGILDLPLAMKYLGIIPGIILLVIYAIFGTLSFIHMIKIKDITQKYSLTFYSKICFGIPGSILIKFILCSITLIISAVYLKIFGSLFQTVFLLIVDHDPNAIPFYLEKNFFSIVIFILMMPLMFKKDLSSLAKFNSLGVFAVFTSVISLVIVYFYKLFNNELHPFDKSMLYPKGTKLDIVTALCSLINVYGFQFNCFPIYFSLKNRNTKKMIGIGIYGVSLAMILYITVAIMSYLMYGDTVVDILLIYFIKDVSIYKNKNIIIAAILSISAAGMLLSCMLSLPIFVVNLKNNLSTLINYTLQKLSNEKKNDIEMVEFDKVKPKQEKKFDLMNGLTHIFYTLILYFTTLILAITADKIIVLNAYNGGIFENLICLISPCLFYLILSKKCNFYCYTSTIVLIYASGAMIGFLATTLAPGLFK